MNRLALPLASASALASLTAGCATAPLVTESSSRAIAKIRADCAADPRCTVSSIKDHGSTWWVTTHVQLPPTAVGGDGDTLIVSKRLDRVIKIVVTQ